MKKGFVLNQSYRILLDKQMSETCVSLWFLFQIPKYIRKGKDIQVVIEKKHIKLSHKDKTGSTVECVVEKLTDLLY
jgi:hypothetical protein